MLFYSANTGGFYDTAIHGNNIPADAVEITADEHQALIEGQSSGKVIVADDAGRPVLADTPAPTAAELLAAKNSEARAYLASTDWYIVRHQETGEPAPADVLVKRSEARASIV